MRLHYEINNSVCVPDMANASERVVVAAVVPVRAAAPVSAAVLVPALVLAPVGLQVVFSPKT